MTMHEVKLTVILRDLSDLAPLVAELRTNERTSYVRVDQVQELGPMVAEHEVRVALLTRKCAQTEQWLNSLGCTCRVWKTDKPCEQWLLTRKCAQTEQWLNSLFGADVKLELELKERGET